MQVSIHKLKNHLSKYLHLVQSGESILVTSHRTLVAKLLPIEESDTLPQPLLATTGFHWNGKKPQGGQLMPIIKGVSAAENI